MLETEEELAQLRQANGELEARCAEDARQLEAAGWREEELENRLASTQHEAEEAHDPLQLALDLPLALAFALALASALAPALAPALALALAYP